MPAGARHGQPSLLERLPQGLERVPPELRDFIHEQDPTVRWRQTTFYDADREGLDREGKHAMNEPEILPESVLAHARGCDECAVIDSDAAPEGRRLVRV